MTEIEPFPLTPYLKVRDQNRVDRETAAPGHHKGRPVIYETRYTPEYHRNQLASYPEWAVACPFELCPAGVGEGCTGRVVLHAARKEAYRQMLKRAGGPDFSTAYVKQPEWAKALRRRMWQRALVVDLERSAYNQTLASSTLRDSRRAAEAMGVDPAMIERAVNYGHHRAGKYLKKQRKRSREILESRIQRFREGYPF